MKIDTAEEFVLIGVKLIGVKLYKASYLKGKMKRLLFLILLTVAVFTVAGSLCGHQLWAKSLNNKNKQIIVTARSFTGTMKSLKASQWADTSKGTAARVSMVFDLSKDKTSVTQISISIEEIKYEVKTFDWTKTGTRTGAKVFLNGPLPIENNVFQSKDEKDTIFVKGAFVSRQKAQGFAHLYTSVTIEGTRFDVDLGEWQWKATGH
jgi:hypothetical protein